MNTLLEVSHGLIALVDSRFKRYIYDQINWEGQFIGLVGPCGVGKTTLVLQYLKAQTEVQNVLYVTADDFYFAKNRLLDLASDFVKWVDKF